MPAIARFDVDGLWLSTSVCDGAACPQAASLGVRWGRWSDGGESSVDEAERARAFIDLRRQIGPHVVERVHFADQEATVARARPQEMAGDASVACVFLRGSALLSLRTTEGFTGLLLDAGEWVLLPAGVAHVFDAGPVPEVSFLRLSAGRRGWFPLPTGRPLPPALPARDAFVDQLLVALGEDIEE